MPSDPIPIGEARAAVLAAARPLPPEAVPAAAAALGRVLAEDVASDADLPAFDSSAMDGYAVVAVTEPAELEVVAEARAGAPSGHSVVPGEAVRISTGAALPPGADAVVPVERVTEANGRVSVPAVAEGANVRRAGEDVQAGQLVMRAGADIGPAEVAMLASLGRIEVLCGRRPRVAVVVTGDELADPGTPLAPGGIYNSNGPGLAAQATAAGAVVTSAHVGDDLGETRAALADALAQADVVCVSGGVSVGPHDHVKPALRELGVEERFWGVALKPGKPTWFGVAPDGGALVVGLPGNPVSAMVTFHLFARPALRALAGADPADTRVRARLAAPVARNPRREQAVRCRLTADDGGWLVDPTGAQGSHRLSSLLGAGALALIPRGEGEVAAGERVHAELLPRGTFSG